MKNNKIHALLGVITEPGTESKENWRYDELPAKLGIPEIEIMGYCDILEKMPSLLAQNQSEGYFSRKYFNCRKIYLTKIFKEDEPIKAPSKLPDRIIAAIGVVAAIAFGILSHIRQNTVERQEGQLVDKQVIIDTLSNQVDRKDRKIEKLNQKIDSIERPPEPKK
jgi:hypothetical protein